MSLFDSSFHVTKGQLLLCDLQGGQCDLGFILTDPVIMSQDRDYGPTDLGQKGIATFFSNHKCTQFCGSKWLKPKEAKAYFLVQPGSMMLAASLGKLEIVANKPMELLSKVIEELEELEIDSVTTLNSKLKKADVSEKSEKSD